MENITTRRKKEYSNYIFKNSEFSVGLFACFAYQNFGPTSSPGDEVVFGQIIADSGLPNYRLR